MASTLLEDLPDPPTGRKGWPWTEQSDPLPETQPNGERWPKISIVTPSYNQGQFIEETIRSVLLQGYPNLEYIVVDGGSTDETVEILEKYDPWIDHWVSEPDEGQSHAINKGFQKCSGTHGNWINSDDVLRRGAVGKIVSKYGMQNNEMYVGKCLIVDKKGDKIRLKEGNVETVKDLILERDKNISQPSVLFPLSKFREVGGVDILSHYAMDFLLWGELFLLGVRPVYIDVVVSKFRLYDGQKISHRERVVPELVRNARALMRNNKSMPKSDKNEINEYLKNYIESMKTNDGRLVRWGLPYWLVRTLRKVNEKIRP
jgi:glycosyltransferase involved in cell wall biosynthesis